MMSTMIEHPSSPVCTFDVRSIRAVDVTSRCVLVCALLAGLTGGRTADAHTAPESKDPPGLLAMDVFAHGGIVDLLLFEQSATGPELRHQRSRDGAMTWTAPVTIGLGGRGIYAHRRGMDPQIASAGDVIVVLWSTPSAEACCAGTLATAMSRNGGVTWSSGPNPSDDRSATYHNFLDLAVDAAGRFVAFWLDSRGKARGVRTASSSDQGRTWSTNATVDSQTCECCWNKSLALDDGRMFVLYRDKKPSDMGLAMSRGGGAWTRLSTVGTFNWWFDGCPHVGGGLARTKDATAEYLHAVVWTGAEGHGGAHVLRSTDGGQHWSAPARLGSARSKYTDLAAEGRAVAAVWDDAREGTAVIVGAVSVDHGSTWSEPVLLSHTSSRASHPAVISTARGFVAFWSERGEGKDAQLEWKSALLNPRPATSAAQR